MRCPSGKNATSGSITPLVNEPAVASPVTASYKRIMPSDEAEVMRFPSGENFECNILAVDGIGVSCKCAWASQMRTVSSYEADSEAMRCSESSSEKATELTKPRCPVNGPATTSPVVTSHTRVVQSDEGKMMHCQPRFSSRRPVT
jgi:hypothetical protein